jgi:glutaconate CoA-transferase subunit A
MTPDLIYDQMIGMGVASGLVFSYGGNPGVGSLQEADGAGNVQLWGIPGVQKEAGLGARRSLVTVERIVEAIEPRPGGIVIPGWAIDAVAEASGGSLRSYSLGVTERDNDFYKFWDKLSRDRDDFRAWMDENVMNGAAA